MRPITSRCASTSIDFLRRGEGWRSGQILPAWWATIAALNPVAPVDGLADIIGGSRTMNDLNFSLCRAVTATSQDIDAPRFGLPSDRPAGWTHAGWKCR